MKNKKIILSVGIFSLICFAMIIPIKILNHKTNPESAHIIWPEICVQHAKFEGYKAITGFTLGNEAETDSSPCEGAYGDDLCALAAEGVTICASNEFERLTRLKFDDIECQVMDRMNSRFANRVDLAFTEYGLAKEFGLHYAAVYKLNDECYE
jgi:hypothetical protein